MKNIEKKKTKTGPRYRGNFMKDNNVFRSPWYKDDNDAEDWVTLEKAKVIEGTASLGAEIRLEDFGKEFLERYAFPKKVFSAAIRDEQHLRLHVYPTLGKND